MHEKLSKAERVKSIKLYAYRKSRTRAGLSARSCLVRPKQSKICSIKACAEEYLMQGVKHLIPQMYLRDDKWPLRKRTMAV